MSAEPAVILNDPDAKPIEDSVQFRLTYDGPLRSTNAGRGKAAHKHDIRKVFHAQLKQLWVEHPRLKPFATSTTTSYRFDDEGEDYISGPYTKILGDKYNMFGLNFVPLVRAELGVSCSIDVLLLRPGPPGSILKSGDIDNRFKTLFDALSIPESGDGVSPPTENETPFFVLTRNDKLITRVAMEADMLLEPTGKTPKNERFNDSRLVISVDVRPVTASSEPMDSGVFA